jgi:hypothetical protein
LAGPLLVTKPAMELSAGPLLVARTLSLSQDYFLQKPFLYLLYRLFLLI